MPKPRHKTQQSQYHSRPGERMNRPECEVDKQAHQCETKHFRTDDTKFCSSDRVSSRLLFHHRPRLRSGNSGVQSFCVCRDNRQPDNVKKFTKSGSGCGEKSFSGNFLRVSAVGGWKTERVLIDCTFHIRSQFFAGNREAMIEVVSERKRRIAALRLFQSP